jgi:ketosteroid isomerase-like protein
MCGIRRIDERGISMTQENRDGSDGYASPMHVRVLSSFYEMLDAGDLDGIVSLFAPDGVMLRRSQHPGETGLQRAVGHDAIRADLGVPIRGEVRHDNHVVLSKGSRCLALGTATRGDGVMLDYFVDVSFTDDGHIARMLGAVVDTYTAKD